MYNSFLIRLWHVYKMTLSTSYFDIVAFTSIGQFICSHLLVEEMLGFFLENLYFEQF